MNLNSLPDDFTSEQFMLLDKESLDQIVYDQKKWICQCKDCIRGTMVRDYGISPFFFWRNKWVNLNYTYFMCAKHFAIFNRVKRTLGKEAFEDKFLDRSKMPVENLISK